VGEASSSDQGVIDADATRPRVKRGRARRQVRSAGADPDRGRELTTRILRVDLLPTLRAGGDVEFLREQRMEGMCDSDRRGRLPGVSCS
jgi:hypothetical protein